MDNDGKREQAKTQIVPAGSASRKSPKWHLSKSDKSFLLKCNINPK